MAKYDQTLRDILGPGRSPYRRIDSADYTVDPNTGYYVWSDGVITATADRFRAGFRQMIGAELGTGIAPC